MSTTSNRQLSLWRGWRVFQAVLAITWDVAKGRFTAGIALSFAVVLATSLNALMTKQVVNHLVARDYSTAAVFAGIAVVLYTVNLAQGSFNSLMNFDLSERLSHALDMRLADAMNRPAGLDHIERAEYANKLEVIQQNSYIPVGILDNVNALVFIGIGLIVGSVLLATIQPLLALAVLVAAPVAWLEYWTTKRYAETFGERMAPEQRMQWFLFRTATTVEPAKELRLFNLGPFFVNKHREISDGYLSTLIRRRYLWSFRALIAGVLYAAILAGAIYWVATLVFSGHATLGDLAMAVQLLQQVISRAQQIGVTMTWAAELMYSGGKYLWLLEYADPLSVDNPAAPPERVRTMVRFEDVHFTYPGTDKEVLRGVDFEIPAGGTVAIVGDNGAGKTSIVKLLCRFYDPSSGRITVDGVDLKDVDATRWREGFAVAFQDFFKFQFNLQESVGIGEVEHVEDRERVAAAVARSGSGELVDALPEGYETQLGKWFNGQELSQGQWQRIAIARGAMPEHPKVLILDEPTASLDAKAEHEVFELFEKMAKPQDGAPPVTLLVSHRFSTVRMADTIVVLEEGRVVESGSHEELMARRGRYAEMFNLQASRYD